MMNGHSIIAKLQLPFRRVYGVEVPALRVGIYHDINFQLKWAVDPRALGDSRPIYQRAELFREGSKQPSNLHDLNPIDMAGLVAGSRNRFLSSAAYDLRFNPEELLDSENRLCARLLKMTQASIKSYQA